MQANPENPRPSSLELEEKAADLRARGQLQNINVMTRERFLTEKPYLADRISKPYVVINGCIRLAAAPLAGLEGLKYEVRDEWNADDIDEAVVAENEQRDRLNPMLLGRQLTRMLERPKYRGPGDKPSMRKLAAALNKKHPWVVQYVGLTRLHQDLQDAVENNGITFELARECVRLHQDLQPALAAGDLPSDVAKAWLVKLRIDADEQWRRWVAGAPFEVDPVKDAPPAADVPPKPVRAKPVLVFRVMERTTSSIAATLRDQLSDEEVADLVRELTETR
ncbi:ParB family chromosome partitioning protein [Kutzneria viridogrisea]|uniref:ParB family chromosome partitioning protein n=1 Tax=Kutzneria viridogrisea TaxID=47990 RepID=A0ABR6BZ27_9PSEU|nr:ParB family chromosome partitioning protein [Kutzneria viridogrisea]